MIRRSFLQSAIIMPLTGLLAKISNIKASPATKGSELQNTLAPTPVNLKPTFAQPPPLPSYVYKTLKDAREFSNCFQDCLVRLDLP